MSNATADQEKSYPWQSAHAGPAAAEKLINDFGCHRLDPELADAIFGS